MAAFRISRAIDRSNRISVTPFGILGTNSASIVVAVGSDVQGIAVGGRVCGAQNAMHAASPERGAFGQWNANNGDAELKLPPPWTTRAGATLATDISTAGIAIKLLGLPLPNAPVERRQYRDTVGQGG
ncbi:hypothetical protein LY78DRAFT_697031 [Colletotrichum sublineola]|nr:hypothetical protein LY78DRAFT_697031 [Colletotrichum sublineola]